jgi:hypothetical protein
MWRCQEESSKYRLFPKRDFLVRHRIEGVIGNIALAIVNAKWPWLVLGSCNGPNLSNGDIAIANEDDFASLNLAQIAGEVGLGVVYVDPDHDLHYD